jgi:hypothetical protein
MRDRERPHAGTRPACRIMRYLKYEPALARGKWCAAVSTSNLPIACFWSGVYLDDLLKRVAVRAIVHWL